MDDEIPIEEVQCAINSLKRNKSAGTDNLLNEYFLDAGDILAVHLTDLFNGIFNSGTFPALWSQGIIVPVFKKGDLTDVNNYRAIILVSCMAKLFTNILNKRICKWAETNEKISDAQFGFQKGNRSQMLYLSYFRLSNIFLIKINSCIVRL